MFTTTPKQKNGTSDEMFYKFTQKFVIINSIDENLNDQSVKTTKFNEFYEFSL